MDISKNYYETLGVAPSADFSVIKAAYRVLSQKFHPDKRNFTRDYATRIMIELNEAWSILSDSDSRKKYDEESPFGYGHSNLDSSRQRNSQTFTQRDYPLSPSDELNRYSVHHTAFSQPKSSAPLNLSPYFCAIFSSILEPFFWGSIAGFVLILFLLIFGLGTICLFADLITFSFNWGFYLMFDDFTVENFTQYGEMGPTFIALPTWYKILYFASAFLWFGYSRNWWNLRIVDKSDSRDSKWYLKIHDNVPKSIQTSIWHWRCITAFFVIGFVLSIVVYQFLASVLID